LLTWDSSFSASPSASGVFSTAGLFDFGADDFGIIVIEDGDGSCQSGSPVINRGDKAILTINASACFNGLPTREDINGMVVSEEGAPGVFLFRTPAVSTKTVVELM
jgi:archaellin